MLFEQFGIFTDVTAAFKVKKSQKLGPQEFLQVQWVVTPDLKILFCDHHHEFT
jgi:hypothetical protein